MKAKIALIMILAPFALNGCGGNDRKESRNNVTGVSSSSADIYFKWNEKKIQNLIKEANSNNIDAAKDLYNYYLAHGDKQNSERWEEWLIANRDPETMTIRASRLYNIVIKMDDFDGRKLTTLEEARNLLIGAKSKRDKNFREDDHLMKLVDKEIRKLR